MATRHIARQHKPQDFPVRSDLGGHVIMGRVSAPPSDRLAPRRTDRGETRYDALIIGAGPSGAACAYWLAMRGHRVLVVEKKRFPREKTCGDGLTPRAVRQLHDMGLAEPLREFHRFDGLRSIAHGVTLELEWPDHPDFPAYGYVVRRRELDEMVANQAVKAGATLWQATEALTPVVDGGFLGGAVVRRADEGVTQEVRARYVVVADGANSRFGRALGTARDRSYPLGMAIRGYFTSPHDSDSWIESHLDIRDRDGNHLPGYGWIFPVGDGTVNVGVGLLSTFAGWKNVNTTHLMDAFRETAPARWGISPGTATCAPTGGRLPTGGSVTPRVGPTFLVVGDAGGSVNPFNGEGISVAYETGRLAADAVDLALTTGDALALQTYEQRFRDVYGLYFKTARAFVRAIGNPAVMRELTRVGMQSRTLMEWVLRIMANLLRPDEIGPAESVYRSLAVLVAIAPEP
jgi:geranylgeranyl reductase family protein